MRETDVTGLVVKKWAHWGLNPGVRKHSAYLSSFVQRLKCAPFDHSGIGPSRKMAVVPNLYTSHFCIHTAGAKIPKNIRIRGYL